jgi:hypothetical protein
LALDRGQVNYMIDGLVSGRMFGDAEERTDKTGKLFSVAKVRASPADGETVFVNVIAFDSGVRAALHHLRDGDAQRWPVAWYPRYGPTNRVLLGQRWTWWRNGF